MFIYKITNLINSLSYIGQTVRDPHKRWMEHKNDASKKHSPFHNALLKYGFENFKFEVLFVASSLEELNKKEEELVSFNVYPNGYNLKQGGNNKRFSEFSKNKLSNSCKGRIVSDDQKMKIGNSIRKQNNENAELFQKRMDALEKYRKKPGRNLEISDQFKKLWKNESYRQKMSKTRKGVPKSESHAANISAGRSKIWASPFNAYKINKDGTKDYVGTWENITPCANELGLMHSKISLVLSKHRKSHKGFYFERLNKEN